MELQRGLLKGGGRLGHAGGQAEGRGGSGGGSWCHILAAGGSTPGNPKSYLSKLSNPRVRPAMQPANTTSKTEMIA
jgi:hypothetical protein